MAESEEAIRQELVGVAADLASARERVARTDPGDPDSRL